MLKQVHRDHPTYYSLGVLERENLLYQYLQKRLKKKEGSLKQNNRAKPVEFYKKRHLFYVMEYNNYRIT